MREYKFRGFSQGYNNNKVFNIDQLTVSKCIWNCEGGQGVCIPWQPHIEVMQYTRLKR